MDSFGKVLGPDCQLVLFLLCQAKRAVQRGATAVIFDVSENPEAIDQVRSKGPVKATSWGGGSSLS